LLAQLQSTWQNYDSINQRIVHYRSQILPQMSEQSEAALSAYTTDDGIFSDVMRAKISQLNTELELIQLQNKQAVSLIQLDYFFTNSAENSPRFESGEQP
jgi:outer membrane protein TolC